uniref:DUF2382 domain-containing protein n=1 Tax=uncultured Armatimonadetes bacterium TaxID=157466 RepID=A0A6J4K5H6_9BACT|nr:hypothetical protein AVDCRST_MAG63-4749 [uncultured Armatimonadetes bacterium]
MISSGPLTIVDRDGTEAVGETVLDDSGGTRTLVRLADGDQPVVLPPGSLVGRGDGTYYLSLSLKDLFAGGNTATASVAGSAPAAAPPEPVEVRDLPVEARQAVVEAESARSAVPPVAAGAGRAVSATEAVVVPLISERMTVEKQVVETGGVRITKRVHERQETFDEPLVQEQVDVQHVPVNRIVDGPIAVRHEGDTLVIPLLEEVLVVEKRLMLKEEVRVTRRKIETRDPRTVTLRREEAVVERFNRQASGEETAVVAAAEGSRPAPAPVVSNEDAPR